MPNDHSTKSRKKKKKTIRKAMLENSEERQPEAQPKFTSKAVESDDHYVVFQFEPAKTAEGPPPPGTPAAETPSPAAGNTPNDYEHMVPSNLQHPTPDIESSAGNAGKGEEDSTPQSGNVKSPSGEMLKKARAKQGDASTKSHKKKKKNQAPAEAPPKFEAKAVESDDHYVVFKFEPVADGATPGGTPTPQTPSPMPSPNDYEHMVPKNLPQNSAAVPVTAQKAVSSKNWDMQSTKSRKAKNKNKKEDVPRLDPENQPKKTSIESMSKKARKKKGANGDKSTKSRKLKKNANKKKGGDGS
ncbi:hypothetical protein Ddc_17348 [Ditylenchus destructor]|nr:hypothetical protein Ddc_17348 [Ditylenchus destructor]